MKHKTIKFYKITRDISELLNKDEIFVKNSILNPDQIYRIHPDTSFGGLSFTLLEQKGVLKEIPFSAEFIKAEYFSNLNLLIEKDMKQKKESIAKILKAEKEYLYNTFAVIKLKILLKWWVFLAKTKGGNCYGDKH